MKKTLLNVHHNQTRRDLFAIQKASTKLPSIMKAKIFAATFVCFFAIAIMALHGADAKDARGSLELTSMSVWNTLQYYQESSGVDLIISGDIKRAGNTITMRIENSNRTETVEALKHALLRQAGVVITPLESGRESATYDDKIELGAGLKIESPDTNAPGKNSDARTGAIDFQNLPVDKFLNYYQSLTGSKLLIDSEARHGQKLTLKSSNEPAPVVRQKMEQTLLKQAGILITPLNHSEILVTRNDKLSIEKPEAKSTTK